MAPPPAPGAAASGADNLKSALFMTASMAGIVVNDTLMKTLAGEVPLVQAIFLRGLAATALLALLGWRLGVLGTRPEGANRGLLALRVAAEVGATLCFLSALFHMPLANATAILMVLPLAVTLAAAVAFDEAVGWRRYAAIAVGFVGVVLIVRPGTAGFNAYALLALASVGFVVVRDLATRRFSQALPSTFAALATSVAITLTGALLLPAVEPVTPTPGQLLTLVAAAVCLVVAYLFAVMTMRIGDVGFVSPFRYTNLIWALVLGALVFGEFPDGLTLAGSALVVATGLYTLHREHRLARRL